MKYKNFLLELPSWCREALISAPLEYKNIIQNTSSDSLNKLINFFKEIDDLGVMGFGYRCFWKNGETSIFAINKEWYDLVNIAGFKLLNLAFVRSELLLSVKSNTNFLTRSSDKINNEYLATLDCTSINNGVVLYNYSRSRVDVFYFHCVNPEGRDFLLNKLNVIQALLSKNIEIFRCIIDSNEFSSFRTHCLNQEQRLMCFNDSSSNNIISHGANININGRDVKLSSTDIECLFFLKYGSSITYIAERVGRSPSTIKDRMRSLRDKLHVQTKDELTLLARKKLAYLTKDSIAKNNINTRRII
jgi:DNA-binding CsgD family transcriptional regulator